MPAAPTTEDDCARFTHEWSAAIQREQVAALRCQRICQAAPKPVNPFRGGGATDDCGCSVQFASLKDMKNSQVAACYIRTGEYAAGFPQGLPQHTAVLAAEGQLASCSALDNGEMNQLALSDPERFDALVLSCQQTRGPLIDKRYLLDETPKRKLKGDDGVYDYVPIKKPTVDGVRGNASDAQRKPDSPNPFRR